MSLFESLNPSKKDDSNVYRSKGNEVKRPIAVLIAEAFLIITLAIYFAKICVLGMAMYKEIDTTISWNLFFFFMEVAMLCLTANAMVGLSSRRESGWKRAVTSSGILFLLTIFGKFLGQSMSAASTIYLPPEIVAPLTIAVIILMLLPSTRDFYVPPMETRLPLSSWVRYAFYGKLYNSGVYRISYENEDEEDQGTSDKRGFWRRRATN